MKLTSHPEPLAITSAAPEDGFEELRVTFLERLKSERQRLLHLSAVLAQGKMGRVPVLGELRSRAHRLSGTAAVLDLRGVAALAHALELAVEGMVVADRALSPRAENSDRVMCAALQALIQAIDSLNDPSRDLQLYEGMETARRMILNG
jgi:HPt (histidine-containing phosphotransfer) domain-containing protein